MACSDPLGLTAQPVGALRRVGPRKDLDAIRKTVDELGVGLVVVGLPLLLSGEEGSQAIAAREFADRLRKRLPSGVEVAFWDERLSSAEVERAMISDNVRRRKRRERVDALAAVVILQGYLDAHGHATAPPS
jgi:putative Holliday junction resolvase